MRHLFILVTVLLSTTLYSQVNKIETQVKEYLKDSYISDGQIYRVMLNHDEEGEFDVTLFGNTKYRLAFASTLSQANLIFTVIDSKQNVLFTNRDYDNLPYWDLIFTSTINCKIQVKLEDKQKKSGIAIMMIGYK